MYVTFSSIYAFDVGVYAQNFSWIYGVTTKWVSSHHELQVSWCTRYENFLFFRFLHIPFLAVKICVSVFRHLIHPLCKTRLNNYIVISELLKHKQKLFSYLDKCVLGIINMECVRYFFVTSKHCNNSFKHVLKPKKT